MGSFTHAVAVRLVKPHRYKRRHRSVCDYCGRVLHPLELLPVISFLVLKGRCRTCHARLSPTLIIAELFSGIFYMWVFSRGFSDSMILLILLVFHLLLACAITDLYSWLIPNRILVLIFLISFVLFPTLFKGNVLSHVLGLAIGFLLPFLVVCLSKRGLGGGDVKLFATLGWLLGVSPLLLGMVYSCFLGLLFFCIHLLFLSKRTRLRKLPFAPFILVGFILVLFQLSSTMI